MITLSAGWGYFDPEDPPVSWGADVDAGTPGDLLDWIRSALAGGEDDLVTSGATDGAPTAFAGR